MPAALVCKTKSMEFSFAHKNQLLFDGCHYDFQTDSKLREWQPRYKSKLVGSGRYPKQLLLTLSLSSVVQNLKVCKSAASRAPPSI